MRNSKSLNSRNSSKNNMEEQNQKHENWHHPAKHPEATTERVCRFCKKHVKALEAHMHDKHHNEVKREQEHH